MKTLKHALAAVITVATMILAGACSVEITQTSTAPTHKPPTATATRKPTNTPLPPTETPVPTATRPGDEMIPTDTPTPTPTPLPFDYPLLDDSSLEYTLMSGWEDLGLKGKLIFLSFTETGQSVVAFDFETGRLSPIFLSPADTWVLAASLLPDRSNMLIAYAPPPPEGESQYGYSDLYTIRPGGEPEPLLERTEEIEAYFSSFYSPDGLRAYFSWFFVDESVGYGFRYHIKAMDLATGESEVVVEDGFWGTVTRDGSQLAYVTFDPDASPEDPAELRVLDLETGETTVVLDPERFPTVDAPFFSPDGSYLYFSAVSSSPGGLSWLDRILGVTLASAHQVPSDWWRVNLASFEVERVTEIFDQGMYGDFAPDREIIAYISATGLWVMNPDGSGLTQIIESSDFYGNLEWIP